MKSGEAVPDPVLLGAGHNLGTMAFRSCCKTHYAWNNCVAQHLKILMYNLYTPVFRRLAPCASVARDCFTTTS